MKFLPPRALERIGNREETDKDLFSERARADAALATRDAFLGVVSHDLRSMLNAMVGFAVLIEQGASQEDRVAEVLEHAGRIRRSGA
jgi:signal transduction histidine kinase